LRFSIDIPDDLADAMRDAAHDAKYKSVSEWARHILAQAAGVEINSVTWGRAKVDAVPEVTEVPQLKVSGTKPKPKAVTGRVDLSDEPEYVDIEE
jgi:hypothetical protein